MNNIGGSRAPDANKNNGKKPRQVINCPCMLIAAPSSGSGKTTLTAALARWHGQHGRRVKIFKAGPDFIDPMILQQSCGSAVYSLDLGMMSENHCRQLLYQAALEADLILIEGVMGLFDSQFSAAVIAKTFSIPVAIVIDVRAMAETFGAVAYGLATIDKELKIIGAFANRVASERHQEMAHQGLQTIASDIRWLGAMRTNAEISFPERHLGLVQAQEIQNLREKLNTAAGMLDGQAITDLPPEVRFTEPDAAELSGTALRGKTITIARDNAFSFVYAANLDFFKQQGANIKFVSPLADNALPDCDIFYIPGGYPELYAEQLSSNNPFKNSVHAFKGRILAECGGMIYLSEALTDLNGNSHALCGLLPIRTQMQKKLQAIGWQKLQRNNGDLLAHSFHYSSAEFIDEKPNSKIISEYASTRNDLSGEAIYQLKNITASYLHWYFPSNATEAIRLLLNTA